MSGLVAFGDAGFDIEAIFSFFVDISFVIIVIDLFVVFRRLLRRRRRGRGWGRQRGLLDLEHGGGELYNERGEGGVGYADIAWSVVLLVVIYIFWYV